MTLQTETTPLSVQAPAPRPWDWTGIPTRHGAGHVYITDANGRKIATIWGKKGETESTAVLIVNLVLSHASFLLTPVVGLLLCTPKYLTGMMTLGEVAQAAAAFAAVHGAFSWITDSYARIAEWASSANRVASLLLALDQIDQPVRTTERGVVARMEDGELTA